MSTSPIAETRHTPIVMVDGGALIPRLLNECYTAMRQAGVPVEQCRDALNIMLFGTPTPGEDLPGQQVRTPLRGVPAGVPCAVCLTQVTHWVPLRGDRYQALPCRHTTDDIAEVWLTALDKRLPRVTL